MVPRQLRNGAEIADGRAAEKIPILYSRFYTFRFYKHQRARARYVSLRARRAPAAAKRANGGRSEKAKLEQTRCHRHQSRV